MVAKGFEIVKVVEVAGEGMPRARDEWVDIMEFWSERLGRKMPVKGVFEVLGGGSMFQQT
jgi:hypothetical protein